MHFLKKKKLNRRTVLRGLMGGSAVCLGLPMLEAMLNDHGTAHAGGAELPRYFATWFFGNGVLLDRFEPTAVGAEWELSPLLAPLAPVKDHVSVCTGLQNRCQQLITHHEGMTLFSGYTFMERPDLGGLASDPGGPTIDQRVAQAIISGGTTTPVRSIQAQISKGISPADNGTTADTLSARGEPGAIIPLPPESSPRALWETIFGEFVPAPDDSELRISAIDLVREDAARLRARVGVADQQRIDAHLQGLSELEAKILAAPPTCDLPRQPGEENLLPVGQEQLTLVNEIMGELIAQAFACDITRVSSTMFLPLAGETPFSELGHADTHHIISHGAEAQMETRDEYHNGIVYIMERYSAFLQTLQSMEDPMGGTLLDASIVMAGSDCAVGWHHGVDRQPLLIAGHGRGHLVHPGIHYQSIANDAGDPNQRFPPTQGSTSDALLSMLRAYEPDAADVGGDMAGSNTPIEELLA